VGNVDGATLSVSPKVLDEMPLYVDEEAQDLSRNNDCECENHSSCGCDYYGYN
jgi:hypothetical protein